MPIKLVLFLLLLNGCALFPINTVDHDGASKMPISSDRSDQESFKRRAVLLPFRFSSIFATEPVVKEARQAFVDSIMVSQQIILVDSGELNTPLSSQNGEWIPGDKLVERARELGIPAIIEPHILDIRVRRLGDQVGLFRKLKIEIEAKVRARVIATSSGQILFDENQSAMIESEVVRIVQEVSSDRLLVEDPQILADVTADALKKLTPGILASLKKISWGGRIALIQGDRIYVNAGQLSGLKMGDLLRVSEAGRDIFDPDTGAFIGRVAGRMKGTLEVVSYFGKDGAITLVHSGSGFSENDLVELY